MNVREIYEHEVRKLSDSDRVKLATWILSQGDSEESGSDVENLAMAGARLASGIGPPDEFADWERAGA